MPISVPAVRRVLPSVLSIASPDRDRVARQGYHAWCEVDLDRCIGCAFCVRVPKKKADPYELKICPWDAIEMVPTEFLPQAVEVMGGPAAMPANPTTLARSSPTRGSRRAASRS